MVGTTHYDTLGVKPTATADEIARAYAREVLRPRAFGGLAQVGIAYATLKDAAKRRAYDAAIGIRPESAAVAPQMPRTWQIAASAHVLPATQAVLDTLRRSPPPAEPPPPAQEAPVPAAPSFIASSLRELADPAPLIRRAPERLQPETEVSDAPAPAAERVAEPAAIEQQWPDAEPASRLAWQRPALIAGGLALAAVLLGAWAGVSIGDPDQAPPPDAITMAVPSAQPRAVTSASSTAPDSDALPAEIRREPAPARRSVRTEAAARLAEPRIPRPIQLTPAEEQELAVGQFTQSATSQAASAAEAISEVQAPAAVTAGPTAAKLPLSERTVARTIGRIGYACGSVASIAPVDATGVFKVTCTSGDSYQARPVRGRYHFRRWRSQ